jgi:predicted RecA/RadA family phage recombinase
MKNYEQPGNILKLTAPVGGVVSGTGYIIGAMLVVALHDADAGESFSALAEGVVELAMEATAATFAEGEMAFWDDTNKRFDNTGSGFYPAATAVEDRVATSTTVKVKLSGQAVVVVP